MKKEGLFDFLKPDRRARHSGESRDEKAEAELQSDRRDMIRGVHALGETTVKEVMVPRVDVIFLPAESSFEEVARVVAETGHSRLPIYRDTIDNVVGILHVKDLIRAELTAFEGPAAAAAIAAGAYGQSPARAAADGIAIGGLAGFGEAGLERIIRKPYFVPESKRIDSLLREMRRRHVHVAIAVDEYGGTSGIVCLEDIIEVIVGEIQDEFDNERDDITPLGNGVYICDGRAGIADLNEAVGLDLPSEEFDTLGGFVFDLFGKIPVKYEKMSARGWDFIIQDMDGHKINTVKLVRQKAPEEAGK